LANKDQTSSPSCTPTGTRVTSTNPTTNPSKNEKCLTSNISGLPEGFVFIDDQRSQAECIISDLKCARTLNLPVTCYHYVPEKMRDPCNKMDKRQLGYVLLKQMTHFIEKKLVLSNQESLDLLKLGSSVHNNMNSLSGSDPRSPSGALGSIPNPSVVGSINSSSGGGSGVLRPVSGFSVGTPTPGCTRRETSATKSARTDSTLGAKTLHGSKSQDTHL